MPSFDLTIKIEHILTFLTVIVALLVAFVAYRQYNLANAKLKFDLFEKRFAIFMAVQSFLLDILSKANVTTDRRVQFLRETQYSAFLFEDDIIKFLKELDNKALEYYINKSKPQTPEVIRIGLEFYEWFEREHKRLLEIFSQYLKFKTWK